MSRRIRGEGTVTHRKDGRWEAKAYLPAANGAIRRLHLYGKTAKEASDKLTVQLAKTSRGIPIPDRVWTISDYLDYYLREIAPIKLRPKTIELYESVIRVHLKPMCGSQSLTRLSVTTLQKLLNDELANGKSLRTVRLIRTVLSAALTRAMREELVTRNVARLVELRMNQSKTVEPWTVAEGTRFLQVAANDPLYAAFLLLMVYGMRRGEVLGLRQRDINWKHQTLHVRQQLQQIHGELQLGPVKTSAGKRDLPLLPQTREALGRHYAAATAIEVLPTGETGTIRPTSGDDLVFLSEANTPIWPRNFVRRFHQLREKAGIRRTRLHDLRHMAITMLKDLHVPDRDIQLIAGHANISTTQSIYQHGNTVAQQEGLDDVSRVLLGASSGDELIGRQTWASNVKTAVATTSFMDDFNLEGQRGLEPRTPCLRALQRLGRDPSLTSVIGQLRSHIHVHVLGAIGVRLGVRSPSSNARPSLILQEWIPLRTALTPMPIPFVTSPKKRSSR
ncbi:tyrosine recombinase XerC [Nocardia sp. NPDC051052]|uniref:tyrosine recombinase XerC n=1 Tax=Nocardia sp. NPDC051052 TaxID=3364322 RepID=UPI0037930AF3